MLTLIAESKTMTACDGAVGAECLAAHIPVLERGASEIMHELGGLSAAELARRLRLSGSLAARLRGMIYEFPDKTHGSIAIEAFTGVVFKALDYAGLDAEARGNVHRDVRIISSLYGWLRPNDIVKAYRLDYTSAAGPEGITLWAYWRDAVTDCLIQELEARGENEVLDLMPGDALRCIDRKRTDRAGIRIHKADFRVSGPGGSERTPDAGRLKHLRGLLLRQIATEGIRSAAELRGLESERYVCRDDAEGPNIVFDTAE